MTIYKPTFYKQYDKKWSSQSWNGTTIGNNGCGPTAVANVVSALTDLGHTDITPKDTYKWICDNGYMTTSGTKHVGIPACLKHYGVKTVSDEITDSKKIKKSVTDGNWAIVLVSKGKWTSGGHYLVLYGIKDSKCLISDSASDSDERQKDGTWKELSSCLIKGWTISDLEDYNPGTATSDDNDDDDDDSDTGVYVDADELKPNILILDADADPSKFKPKTWKKNKVIGVMLEAGSYFDDNHIEKEVFRNPLLYEQVKRVISSNLEFGYFFQARAKNGEEVNKEIKALSYILNKYPPTFGVWLHPDFLSDNKKRNDILFSQYEHDLTRLGQKGRLGIKCKRTSLKKFDWKKFQKTWWLWLNEHVDDLNDIDGLLNPKFFDTDNKSGDLPDPPTGSIFPYKLSDINDYGGNEKKPAKDKIGDAAADWAEKIVADNSFTYGRPENSAEAGDWYHGRDRTRQLGCYFCGTTVKGPKKAKKGSKWEKTYCCNAFVTAAYVHGAHIRQKCWTSGLKVRSWTTKGFEDLGENLDTNKLKRGDVILIVGKHIGIYVGNNLVAEAKGKGWGKNSIRTHSILKDGWKRDWHALRYVPKSERKKNK